MELLSEPLYILAQCLLLLRVRVIIETLATLAKSFMTYALLLRGIGKVGFRSDVIFDSRALTKYARRFGT